MEIINVDGFGAVKFDLVLTLALAAAFLFIGNGLQRRLAFLSRASIPAPVIGGLLFALLVYAMRAGGAPGVALDTTLRAPLQTIFFTTIGLGATLTLLRAGGWRMGFFWLIASATAIVQNMIGMTLALALGAPPALGIICGALTLTGGPATGLAFTESFEQVGIGGAGTLIIASATFGILTSSLVGNPVATTLIKRFCLARTSGIGQEPDELAAPPQVNAEYARGTTAPAAAAATVVGARPAGYVLLRNLAVILIVMGLGALVSLALARLSVELPEGIGRFLKLPGYIGAMVVAAVARNLDDRYQWLRLEPRAVESLGAIALAFFLVIALMDLKLWQLAGLALPMIVILTAQIVVMILYATLVTFTLMGRDYEAAVTASGHIGFGLGITPNAVANMEALTARFGPAPRSFLIVPIVGAFFIDFSNSLIITFFINFLR